MAPLNEVRFGLKPKKNKGFKAVCSRSGFVVSLGQVFRVRQRGDMKGASKATKEQVVKH